MAISNDDLLKYLLPSQAASPNPTPFNLAQALGLEQRPFGAPPSLGVGGLTPPVPMPAGPQMAPPPSLTSMYAQAPAAPPPPVAPTLRPQGPPAANGLGAIQARQQAAVNQELAGLDASAAAKGAVSQTLGEGELAAAAEQRQHMANDDKADAEASAAIADRRKQLYAEVDALGSQRVDPARLYNNQTTGQKITGAIAIALGGFAAGPRGVNATAQIIQKQIDNDVQAQIEDLATRKGALAAKGTLLQQEMAGGRDASDARHKATLALFDVAMREVDAHAKMLGTQAAAADAQLLKGKLLQDVAQSDRAFWTQQKGLELQGAHLSLAKQQFELEQQKNRFTQGLQAGQFARELGKDVLEHTETSEKMAMARAAAATKGIGAGADRLIPAALNSDGTPFIAREGVRHEDVAKLNNEELPEIIHAMQAVDENVRLAREYTRITDPFKLSELAQKMQANVPAIAGLAKGVFGRVNEKELDIVLQSAGDPAALVNRESTMKAFRENLRNFVQEKLRPMGYARHWEPPAVEAPLRSAQGFNAPNLLTERELQNLIMTGGAFANPPPLYPTLPAGYDTPYLRAKLFPVMKPEGK